MREKDYGGRVRQNCRVPPYHEMVNNNTKGMLLEWQPQQTTTLFTLVAETPELRFVAAATKDTQPTVSAKQVAWLLILTSRRWTDHFGRIYYKRTVNMSNKASCRVRTYPQSTCMYTLSAIHLFTYNQINTVVHFSTRSTPWLRAGFSRHG